MMPRLTSFDTDAARQTVDRVLNVPAARRAYQVDGRPIAIGTLHGDAVLQRAMKGGGSVVKVRKLDTVSMRRPSGRSNLPKTASQRRKVRERTEQRRAEGLPPVPMGRRHPLGKALPRVERDKILAIQAAVATEIGVPTSSLSPAACCACSSRTREGCRVSRHDVWRWLRSTMVREHR